MSNVLLIIDMQRFIEDRIKNGIPANFNYQVLMPGCTYSSPSSEVQPRLVIFNIKGAGAGMGSCGGRHHYKLRYQHQRQRSAREKELSEANDAHKTPDSA